MKQQFNSGRRWFIVGASAVGAASLFATYSRPVTAAAVRRGPETQNQKVTAALTRLLEDSIASPGGKATVTVRPTNRASEGYFAEIQISAKPAKVKKLRFSEVTLLARDVRVDVASLMDEGKLKTLDSKTRLRAVVTEADLQDALAQGKRSKEMGIKVKFLGDRVRVTGNWKFAWFSGPAVAEGKLRLTTRHKVQFDFTTVTLNGREMPQRAKDRLAAKINPLVDYEDMPFSPPFKTIKLVGDKAVVST